MLMGVEDRLRNRSKKAQAPVDRTVVLVAVDGERNTVNVLHDKKGRAVRRSVRVVQARDRWMIELREGALLCGKEFPAGRRKPRIAQNFDRHLAAQVHALGKIDHAHAAVTERSLNAIGAELLKRSRGGSWIAENLMRYVGDIAVQQGSAAGVFLQQNHYFGDERPIIGALAFKISALLGFGNIGRLVKQNLDFLPVSAVHLCPSTRGRKKTIVQQASRSSCASHALAARQSRSTVASETFKRIAVSGISSPPKKRLSTRVAWRGFIRASSSRARSRRSKSSPQEGAFWQESSKLTVTFWPPPRFPALRRRAASIKIWRMARAAMRLKCRREVAAISGDLAIFIQASLTRAVGLSVAPGSPRRTLEASRRSSS